MHFIEIFFSNNKKNSKKIWSTFRDLFGGVKERKNIRELLVNDETLTEDEDICKAFNDFFGSIGTKLDSDLPSSSNNFLDFMGPNSDNSFFINPTTPDEISALITKLKKKKTHIDVLPIYLLVKCRHLLSVPLSPREPKMCKCYTNS